MVETFFLYFLLPDDSYIEATSPASLSRYPEGTIAVEKRPAPGWDYDRDTGTWVDNNDPTAELAAERARMVLSRAQFATAAFLEELITEEEATAYAGAGTLPAFAVTAIATLPQPQQAPARILAAGAREIARSNQLIALMQAALDMPDEDVDELFNVGMQL